MHLGTRMPVIAGHEATMATLGKVQAANSGSNFVQANTVSLTLPDVKQNNGNSRDTKTDSKTGGKVKRTDDSKMGEMTPDPADLIKSDALSSSDIALALEGSSSSLLHSNSNIAPHLAVYDRLLKDLEMKRLSRAQQSSSPKNSLPALPKRPVRKKWGLSAPYSAYFQDKVESDHTLKQEIELTHHSTYPTYPVPRHTPRDAPLITKDVRHNRKDISKPSYSEPSRYVASETSPVSRSQEISFVDPHSHPVSILSKSFTQWGSGFRAPTRNDYYEDELKRQRILTAMLQVSASDPHQIFSSSGGNSSTPETLSQSFSMRLSDHKRFLTFCHSAAFEKRVNQTNKDFPKKKVKQKSSRDDGAFITVTSKGHRHCKTL